MHRVTQSQCAQTLGADFNAPRRGKATPRRKGEKKRNSRSQNSADGDAVARSAGIEVRTRDRLPACGYPHHGPVEQGQLAFGVAFIFSIGGLHITVRGCVTLGVLWLLGVRGHWLLGKGTRQPVDWQTTQRSGRRPRVCGCASKRSGRGGRDIEGAQEDLQPVPGREGCSPVAPGVCGETGKSGVCRNQAGTKLACVSLSSARLTYPGLTDCPGEDQAAGWEKR